MDRRAGRGVLFSWRGKKVREEMSQSKSGPVGSRGGGYGLDAELAKKQAEKYDPHAEQMARDWIEAVTRERVEGSFGTALKNGQILCKLINTIKPGSVKKIEISNMPFKQMENISNFLKSSRTIGIAEYELFETVDLYEEKVVFLINLYVLILSHFRILEVLFVVFMHYHVQHKEMSHHLLDLIWIQLFKLLVVLLVQH